MKFTHLIYIPFRGVGVKNGNDDWFRERIEVFKQYTLRSLLNQTNKNFKLWLSVRPEDEQNQDWQKLLEFLDSLGIEGICSYNSLMYHDDKNLEANKNLETRLGAVLLDDFDLIRENNIDYILMTHLDSDDMLHKDVVQEIQSAFKLNSGGNSEYSNYYGDPINNSTKALVFLRGLVYNTDTKELAEWRPRTNPPFHTIIFPKDIFFDAKKHVEYYGDWQSHEDTILVWPFAKLSDYKYCVTVGGSTHISTNWNNPWRGKEMSKELLKDFGI